LVSSSKRDGSASSIGFALSSKIDPSFVFASMLKVQKIGEWFLCFSLTFIFVSFSFCFVLQDGWKLRSQSNLGA